MHRFKFPNREFFGVLVVLAALIAAIAAPAGQVGKLKGRLPNLPTAQIKPVPGPRDVVIDIESFECLDADEDLPISNGDEPYLYARMYSIDGRSVNLDSLGTATIHTQLRTLLHNDLDRDHVKNGDAFGVPSRIGRWEDRVLPINPTSGFPEGMPAQVGLGVIACEQDLSNFNAAALRLQDIFDKFEEQMLGAVRTLNPVGRLQLPNRIVGFFSSRFAMANADHPLGAVDPDDLVGAGFKMWNVPELEAAGAKGVPFTMTFRNLTTHYRINGTARIRQAPLPRRAVLVTIRRVKAIDDLESFGRGGADFQARVVIDGRAFMSPEKSGDTITPNWTFQHTATRFEVPISIELFERDGLTSPDERCDINPRKNAVCLLLKYDVVTGQVTGDAIGPGGRGIVSSGLGDKDRAEIEFTVTTVML